MTPSNSFNRYRGQRNRPKVCKTRPKPWPKTIYDLACYASIIYVVLDWEYYSDPTLYRFWGQMALPVSPYGCTFQGHYAKPPYQWDAWFYTTGPTPHFGGQVALTQYGSPWQNANYTERDFGINLLWTRDLPDPSWGFPMYPDTWEQIHGIFSSVPIGNWAWGLHWSATTP